MEYIVMEGYGKKQVRVKAHKRPSKFEEQIKKKTSKMFKRRNSIILKEIDRIEEK